MIMISETTLSIYEVLSNLLFITAILWDDRIGIYFVREDTETPIKR